MYSKDVYSISRRARSRATDSIRTGWARHRARTRPRLHPVGAEPLARDTCAVRPAVPVDRPLDLSAHRGERGRGGAQPSRGGARRCRAHRLGDTPGPPLRVAEVSALWLGAANPLLLMHLVAGIHNEALMLGLMLTGTEFALRGIESNRPLFPAAALAERGGWTVGPAAMLLLGTVLITMSSQVKLPGLAGAGLHGRRTGPALGRHRAGIPVGVRRLGTLSLAVMAVIGWASGLGSAGCSPWAPPTWSAAGCPRPR